MEIFVLCIISIQIAWVLSVLNTIKKQNYIQMTMTAEQNGWSEEKCNQLTEKALK